MKIAEANGDDHEVGRLEIFQPGDIVVLIGIDDAGLGVDGEQDGTLEAVMLG